MAKMHEKAHLKATSKPFYKQEGEENEKSCREMHGNKETTQHYTHYTALQHVLFQYKTSCQGSLGGAAVWRLPLTQGTILETGDRIPRQASGA